MTTERIRPILGELELPLVQSVTSSEERSLATHPVPGRDGSVIQQMGRHTTRFQVTGIMDGDTSLDLLNSLREMFLAREPFSFVVDIASGSQVREVLIEDLNVREVAGKPQRFEYHLMLDEFVPPPPDPTPQSSFVDDQAAGEAEELQDAALDLVEQGQGRLEVFVDLGEESDADLSRVRIRVQGQTEEGASFDEVFSAADDGVFRREGLPAGEYTVSLATDE